MDLNYLLSRHQISLVNAVRARSPEARCAHAGLATRYAGRVRALQHDLGAIMVLPQPPLISPLHEG